MSQNFFFNLFPEERHQVSRTCRACQHSNSLTFQYRSKSETVYPVLNRQPPQIPPRVPPLIPPAQHNRRVSVNCSLLRLYMNSLKFFFGFINNRCAKSRKRKKKRRCKQRRTPWLPSKRRRQTLEPPPSPAWRRPRLLFKKRSLHL